MIIRQNATRFLLLNAVLWGSSYVWTKMLLSYIPRFTAMLICSFLCMLVLLTVSFGNIRKISRAEVLSGVGISVLSICSNICCLFAVQYTGSSNTAFIVQLSVVITPILAAMQERQIPKAGVVLSAITATAGVFLLTTNGENLKFGFGELAALGNALFFSLYLLALSKNIRKINAVRYGFTQSLTNTAVYLVLFAAFELPAANLSTFALLPEVPLLILISAGIMIFTVLAQSMALCFSGPEKAALLYTLEPVTAAVLGWLLLGESMAGMVQITGGMLILLSMLAGCASNIDRLAAAIVRSAVMRIRATCDILLVIINERWQLP